MITISLDEFGDFEGVGNEKKPVFIAGVIFDDNSIKGEEKQERSRIESYYRMVIAEAANGDRSFNYPCSLHVAGKAHDERVAAVKDLVRKTLGEFLQKGTYKGKPLQRVVKSGNKQTTVDFPAREGRYRIFVFLKSDVGMKKLLKEKTNFLAKDDFGSNLYFHMVSEVIPRIMFHNPRIRYISEVSLNIATRASESLEKSSQRVKDYKKLGYKPEKSKEENKVFFRLTNADTYRSVIAQEMIRSNKSSIQIKDFKVVSIGYYDNAWKQEFLYLADSICSILNYKLKGKNSGQWLEEIALRVEYLTGSKENMIFGYDEVDTIYELAWNKFEEGDYYKALSLSYDGCQLQGAFADYYKTVWFHNLEEKIMEESNVSNFTMSVRKLHETLTNNTLNQEKAMYVLEKLEKMVSAIEPKFRNPESQSVLYYLYDAAVSAYCHIGDSKQAEHYFEKCIKYANRVGIQEFINTRNKMVVFCCDNMDFRRALDIANDNLMYQNFIKNVRNDIPELKNYDTDSVSLGKSYSQQGQVHGFLRYDDTEDIFKQALDCFEMGSADYFITESYLLHHFIDCGKKDLFEKYAAEYFGGKESWSNRLKYLVSEGFKADPLFNFKYALYVYIKALYVFYMEQLTEELWNKLSDIEEYVSKATKQENWKLQGHPAELNYKYLYLIAVNRKDMGAAKRFQEALRSCLVYMGDTEKVIMMFNEAECAHAAKDDKLRDEKTLQLSTFLKKQFSSCKELEISEDGETRYYMLDSLITYMYR